jgi:hypothetical protein
LGVTEEALLEAMGEHELTQQAIREFNADMQIT